MIFSKSSNLSIEDTSNGNTKRSVEIINMNVKNIIEEEKDESKVKATELDDQRMAIRHVKKRSKTNSKVRGSKTG